MHHTAILYTVSVTNNFLYKCVYIIHIHVHIHVYMCIHMYMRQCIFITYKYLCYYCTLYVQHDTTVAAMMSALGVSNGELPPYVATFFIELYSDDSRSLENTYIVVHIHIRIHVHVCV